MPSSGTNFNPDTLIKYQEEHERLKVLLNVAKTIATEINLENLLQLIVDEVKKVLKADRCTVFLLDEERKELWSKVAHGEKEIRFPCHLGIAGYVATTGEVLNIPDAYADPRFNREIDKKTGYWTRSLLTAPLRNRRGEIIGVFQVLNKQDGPFTVEDEEMLKAISAISATQIENAQLYEEQKKTFDSLLETLAATIDARDPLAAGHSKRITMYSQELAKIMGMSPKQREILRCAALLHDFGKIGVRERVLFKSGDLTEEEYEHIKSHVVFTKNILEKIHFSKDLKEVPKIACSHHEKLDGTGYPNRLKGEQIPLGGRILAVVDVFDALTSKRHYRDRMEFEKVMEVLEKGMGTAFDKDCVAAFKKIKLDVLVKILETDFEDRLDPSDLRILKDHDVEDLLKVLRGQWEERKGKPFVEVFLKYYTRSYLGECVE